MWPSRLIQTKHHIGTTGSLGDASADLWKTLLIWSKRVAKDVGAPFRIKFVLLTTGSAPDGSAVSYLRMRDRDETTADQRLLKIATQSNNKGNAEAYAAYKALPEDLRLRFLKAVQMLDGSSNIIDVRDEIARELYHAAGRNQIDHLVERLEGWWIGVVINALSGTGPSAIPVLAIDQRVDVGKSSSARHFQWTMLRRIPLPRLWPNSTRGRSSRSCGRSKSDQGG
jgi:hypothetical protein